jgi:Zn-dependent protease
MALFMYFMNESMGPMGVVALTLVLFFHEMGHYLAMVFFGYQQVHMVFVPFLGAYVSGEKPGAPAWQEAVMILAGPLPGLVLAAFLVLGMPEKYTYISNDGEIANFPLLETFAVEFVPMLIFINAFNLLPFFPLDGGRVANLLLFGRAPVFSALFIGISNLCIAIFGFLSSLWILMAMGIIGLLVLPVKVYQQSLLDRVRPRLGIIPKQLADCTPSQFRWIYWLTRKTNSTDISIVEFRKYAHQIHGEFIRTPLSIMQWLLVGVAYISSWGITYYALAHLPAVIYVVNGTQ